MEDVQAGLNTTIDDALLLTLSDTDVQESLVLALQKLPKLIGMLDSAERSMEFVQTVLSDKESLKGMLAGFDADLGGVSIDKNTILSLIALLDKLPKLVKVLALVEQVADLAESIVTDKDTLTQLTHNVAEWTEPVRGKMQDGLSMMNEAKVRASKDRSSISVFGALKLLKDPTMQRGLRFANAMLAVMSERDRASTVKGKTATSSHTPGMTLNS